jgi:hypothetical protein
MSTRELVLRVPASWTDAEVEERLRRLRAPAETEEQRAKSAAQVEIQTRTLARVVVDVDQLNERVETVEARGLQMVDRGELEQIRAIVDDAMARMHEIDTVAHDARAAVELAEKRMTQSVFDGLEEAKAERRKLWSSIGGLKRWQGKKVTE